MIQNINKELLINLNSLNEFSYIQIIVSYFADLPIFFLPIFLVTYWLYYTFNKNIKSTQEKYLKKELLLHILYSVIIWIAISLSIQQFVVIDRPEEALKWIWQLLLNHIPDASFPSDHATVSVAFLTSLFFAWYKKIWLWFSIFVIIMLISRIIIWVHWPLDILAGIFVWIFSSYISFKCLTKINFIKIINKFIIKILSYIKL